MCFLGVLEFLFSLQILIFWSRQQYSPYYLFDLVYDLLIPKRDQCIFLVHNDQRYRSIQRRSPSNFHIDREVLKNDGGKAGKHWEMKLAFLVPG